MESIRDIRNRMVSVQKTEKITNAMYLMASSKLKKARAQLTAVEPYFERMQYVITDILAHTEEGQQRYFATDRNIPADEVRAGYLVVTSDKGLAGSYNINVCRKAEAWMQRTKHNSIYCVGTTGRNYFAKRPELGSLELDHTYPNVSPDQWKARSLAEEIMRKFLSGELDEFFVVYTRMKNALVSEVEVLQALPLTRNMFPVTLEKDETNVGYHTEYVPSAIEVLDRMVPNYLKGVLFGVMVEAFVAEQNARMTAMKSATDSAEEIVRELSLKYNRVRQAAITTEITEVVAGANAQDQ